MDWAKTTARAYKKHLTLGIWCDLYYRFYGMSGYIASPYQNDIHITQYKMAIVNSLFSGDGDIIPMKRSSSRTWTLLLAAASAKTYNSGYGTRIYIPNDRLAGWQMYGTNHIILIIQCHTYRSTLWCTDINRQYIIYIIIGIRGFRSNIIDNYVAHRFNGEG